MIHDPHFQAKVKEKKVLETKPRLRAIIPDFSNIIKELQDVTRYYDKSTGVEGEDLVTSRESSLPRRGCKVVVAQMHSRTRRDVSRMRRGTLWSECGSPPMRIASTAAMLRHPQKDWVNPS